MFVENNCGFILVDWFFGKRAFDLNFLKHHALQSFTAAWGVELSSLTLPNVTRRTHINSACLHFLYLFQTFQHVKEVNGAG